MKGLDYTVQYDYSLRNPQKNIVSFNLGGDGFNPVFLERVNLDTFELDAVAIRKQYAIYQINGEVCNQEEIKVIVQDVQDFYDGRPPLLLNYFKGSVVLPFNFKKNQDSAYRYTHKARHPA